MLRELLATDVYKLLLVFARLGAAMMLFPGLGGVVVSVRARLMLAVATAFLLSGVLGPRLPSMPPDVLSMALLIGSEVTVGVFFGLLLQCLMAALDLAGNFIGYSTGLTNAFTNDPVTEQQSQLLSGFLNMTATTLVLITDTHHLMLRALVDSYGLFVPGQPLPIDDFTSALVRTLGVSSLVALKLSAPMVVFSLSFNVALGLVNRLVPQMPVFFVGLPVQILGGLAVLLIALPPIMLWFMRHLTDGIGTFLAPG